MLDKQMKQIKNRKLKSNPINEWNKTIRYFLS